MTFSSSFYFYVILILFLGSVEFGPDVTSSDKSIKVMLNSQDKVGVIQTLLNWQWIVTAILKNDPACLIHQVFSEIRNEHFSNVFGFLSQKAKNLQTAYDVSACCRWHVFHSMLGYIWEYSQCNNNNQKMCELVTETAWDGHPADEGICCRWTERTETGTSSSQSS